jgi:hypothetical protein
MSASDQNRLARTAAGRPATLKVSVIQGNGAAPISLPDSRGRDGLVSVIHHGDSGSVVYDITSTASLVAGVAGGDGSIVPGTNVGDDMLTVTWHRFRG